MLRHIGRLGFLGLTFAALPAMGDIPTEISHQGVIAVYGERFTGQGEFYFALVDELGYNLWTNDGTNVGPTSQRPDSPIILTVVNGVYRVRLGNTADGPAMTPIPRAVFNEHDKVALRIWFDDGVHGVHQLTPDQVITGAPYAQRLPNVFVDESTGHVGIGTTDPANQLSVAGSADFSGNVGIGTTTPGTQLQVVGNIHATGTDGAEANPANKPLSLTGLDAGLLIYNNVGNSDNYGWQIFDRGELLFHENYEPGYGGAYRVAIAPGGRVGIGTTAPAEKLDVVGTTRTSRLEVTEASGFGLVPPGAIIPFGGTTPPDGWLLCDGTVVSRTTYSALFAAIGTAWGAGDDSTTFHLPDLRGRFLRGVAHGVDRDPDRSIRTAPNSGGNTGDKVGSVQEDAFEQHKHQTEPLAREETAGGEGGEGFFTAGGQYMGQLIETTFQTDAQGASTETRPENAYVNWIIKY